MFRVEAGQEYPVRPLSEGLTLASLAIKQALLPEGADIVRAGPNEIRELLTLDSGYDMGLQPIDNFYDDDDSDSGIRSLGFGGKRIMSEEVKRRAEQEREGEIWDIPTGVGFVEIVAAKAIRAQRNKENERFADRWVLSRSPSLEGLVSVLPDEIAISGTTAAIRGRYNEFGYFRITRESAETDPNGWKILATLNYDFSSGEGTITLG